MGQFIDASRLPNLKQFLSKGAANTPWSQLEVVKVWDIPQNETLAQVKELTSHTSVPLLGQCPKLEQATLYADLPPDVSLIFDDHQQAQLTPLRARWLDLRNLSTLQSLTVLHCSFDQTLTEDYSLPPNLVEPELWQCGSVMGTPPQIKKLCRVTD